LSDKIRWGIIGTGVIARAFAKSLKPIADAALVAVASRTREKADAFAHQFNVKRAYDAYRKLADDPDVDIIYVGTPHPFHMENTIMSLNAGKAVLCEKPLAINTAQARRMIQTAKDKKLFLMEAMWTRFNPTILQVRNWLRDGLIGDVKMVFADFGKNVERDPAGRFLNPHLGGGALLDLGVYPVSFASMVFGKKHSLIRGFAHLGNTGVDELDSMTLAYDHDRLAVLSCALNVETPKHAYILGTKGYILVHPLFLCPTMATCCVSGRKPRTIHLPWENGWTGYTCQAEAVMNCLRKGRTECDSMPLAESLEIMEVMDELRRQWNLRYPFQ
jgi:dihydrodiol dehydrogenase / D-xylose 1-dehydrogenase (NADP)